MQGNMSKSASSKFPHRYPFFFHAPPFLSSLADTGYSQGKLSRQRGSFPSSINLHLQFPFCMGKGAPLKRTVDWERCFRRRSGKGWAKNSARVSSRRGGPRYLWYMHSAPRHLMAEVVVVFCGSVEWKLVSFSCSFCFYFSIFIF